MTKKREDEREDATPLVEVDVVPTQNGLPQWFVQIVAWITGVGGLYVDYGLGLFGDFNLPWIVYAASVGIGYGLNPDLYAKFFGRK